MGKHFDINLKPNTNKPKINLFFTYQQCKDTNNYRKGLFYAFQRLCHLFPHSQKNIFVKFQHHKDKESHNYD